jgi:hypothetical protein
MRSILFTACLAAIALTVRADDAKPIQKPDKDGFYSLFNGKDLDGWKPSESPETFRVEDGNLVVNGRRSHLYYMGPVHDHNFKNFHLRAEVMSFPKSNSGIYFHTQFQEGGWPDKGFECQVNETHGDIKKTGGLYDIKDVLNESAAKNNEWYTYDIIVNDKHVILKINGKTTCDWTQPDDFVPPKGHSGRIIGSGTIAIQGHDPGSKVLYKSIKIKPMD